MQGAVKLSLLSPFSCHRAIRMNVSIVAISDDAMRSEHLACWTLASRLGPLSNTKVEMMEVSSAPTLLWLEMCLASAS